jgi:hypothetical protein
MAGTALLTVRSEDLDLAEAQAALDADQLEEHVLADEGARAPEGLGDALLWKSQVQGPSLGWGYF